MMLLNKQPLLAMQSGGLTLGMISKPIQASFLLHNHKECLLMDLTPFKPKEMIEHFWIAPDLREGVICREVSPFFNSQIKTERYLNL